MVVLVEVVCLTEAMFELCRLMVFRECQHEIGLFMLEFIYSELHGFMSFNGFGMIKHMLVGVKKQFYCVKVCEF